MGSGGTALYVGEIIFKKCTDVDCCSMCDVFALKITSFYVTNGYQCTTRRSDKANGVFRNRGLDFQHAFTLHFDTDCDILD